MSDHELETIKNHYQAYDKYRELQELEEKLFRLANTENAYAHTTLTPDGFAKQLTLTLREINQNKQKLLAKCLKLVRNVQAPN